MHPPSRTSARPALLLGVLLGLAGPRPPRLAPAPVAGHQPLHLAREDGFEHAVKAPKP